MNTKLVLAIFLLLSAGAQVKEATEKDPHRPACSSALCLRVESFLRAHYCGESPFGNGPDNGCEIKRPRTPGRGVKVLSGFDCRLIEGISKCEQHSQPSSEIRPLLISEMRKLGLPVKDDRQVYFSVWDATSSGWSLAKAYYHEAAGTDLTICQLIAIVDRGSRVRVLRKVPFQKTDAEKPAVTIWVSG